MYMSLKNSGFETNIFRELSMTSDAFHVNKCRNSFNKIIIPYFELIFVPDYEIVHI